MKRALALLITALLFAAALWAGRGYQRGGVAVAVTPDKCIEQMFDAAQRGDVPAYLDCFTGQERQRLDHQLSSQSADEFAAALRTAMSSLEGWALSAENRQPQRADLTVERVYQGRNEVQTYHLQQEAGHWRIADVRSVQKVQPPVPFGTPVFILPAEADPESPGK